MRKVKPMTNPDNRPDRIWAWPFKDWYRGGCSTHKVKVAGAKDVEYVAADLLDAANERVARLEEALRWYGEQVSNCNRHGKEGDTARDTLAKDYGQRAEAALQTEGKEGE